MVKVAGVWELGWSAPLTEYSHWHYPLRDFGVDEWIMCPISGILEKGLKEYADLKDALAENKKMTVVYVDEAGKQKLTNFIHPKNALYVFGRAGMSPLAAYGQDGDLSVCIETPANLGLLWPHQAAVIVLYDRMKKAN